MSRNNLADLLERYQRGECTPEEKARVDAWFEAHGMPETSFEQMDPGARENWQDALFADIRKVNQPPTKSIYRKLYPYAAAAAVLLLVGTGIVFLKSKTIQPAHDIAPYTAQAILKTSGKTIILDQTQNGRIGKTITKSGGELLTYAIGTEKETAPVYDTISIPAGGRPYTIQLSDGSKITLNAATTLRYPEAFSKARTEQVELISGEIYAEIVHDKNAPLQFKAPGQFITDIGTEFNISAYSDEDDSRTTLVEGLVKVNANNDTKNLTPGQQTILTANSLTIGTANIQQVTAWKQGYFRFNGEHIDVIMRQLARWYNIEVSYEGKMTSEAFYGKITRKRNISEVLKMLEKTQKIHFKVEGRRVTVLSKN